MIVWIAEGWSYEDVELEGVYEDFHDALACHHILKTDPGISYEDGVPSYWRANAPHNTHGFRIDPHQVIPSSKARQVRNTAEPERYEFGGQSRE